jgi:RNA polymerase sigma-70 factor (ECF subfamily)
MDEWADHELMTAFYHGNAKAFGRLVARWQKPLARLTARYFRSAAHVDDAVQEVFVKLFLTRDSAHNRFHPDRPFAPWLYRIAHHECINLLRAEHRQPQATLTTDPEDRKRSPDGLREDVAWGLATLDTKERAFIEDWNKGLGNQKQTQIAVKLGVSNAQVSQTIKPSALARLRRALQRLGHE